MPSHAVLQMLQQRAHALAFKHYTQTGVVNDALTQLLWDMAAYEVQLKGNDSWQTQPRVPAGSPDGGQWSDTGASQHELTNDELERLQRVDPPITPVYPVETLIVTWFGGGAFRSAYEALKRVRLAWRLSRVSGIPGARQTVHGAIRYNQRAINRTDIFRAIESAQRNGTVLTRTGKYGTLQNLFVGTNNVTVVVETAGRNAGKIITVYRGVPK